MNIINFLQFFLWLLTGVVTFKIIFLLLVSASIGYVVAWLYFKLLFNKRIKGLKSELDNRLNKQINEKLNEIDFFVKKLDDNIEVPEKTERNKDGKTLISKRTGQKQFEKEKVLIRNIQRKRLLNYKKELESLRAN